MIAPVATVNVETKSIPAKKLPRYPRFPRRDKRFMNQGDWERVQAMANPMMARVMFLYLQPLCLGFVFPAMNLAYQM